MALWGEDPKTVQPETFFAYFTKFANQFQVMELSLVVVVVVVFVIFVLGKTVIVFVSVVVVSIDRCPCRVCCSVVFFWCAFIVIF